MGKIIRFLIAAAAGVITFIAAMGIIALIGLTGVIALVIPVAAALIVYGLIQFVLGIFKLRNLIIFAIIFIIAGFFKTDSSALGIAAEGLMAVEELIWIG